MVVAFTTPEGKAAYAPRRVHCILLDVKSGRVTGEHEWSVLLSRVGLLPTHAGRFAVRENHALVLYSPEFRPLAKFPLDHRDRDIRGVGYLIESTPGHKSIVVQKWFDSDTKAEVTWLDPDTLAPLRTHLFPQDVPNGEFSMRASNLAVAQILFDTLLPGLYVSDRKGPMRRIFDAQADNALELSARFATDRSIMVCVGRRVLLITLDGQTLFRTRLAKHEYSFADLAQISATGSRLALPVERTEGVNNEMLHLSAHPVLKRIMIYDIPAALPACEVGEKDLNLKGLSAFALSPGGKQLALIRDGAVELYGLPPGC